MKRRLTDQQKTIVKRARNRIADPRHWCRGALARMANGSPCFPHAVRAIRFSAVGALAAEIMLAEPDEVWPLKYARDLGARLAERRAPNLEDFNDGESHAAVLALFDQALAD